MKKRILSTILSLVMVFLAFLSSCSAPDLTEPTAPETTIPEIPVRTTPILDECAWYTIKSDIAHTGFSAAKGYFLNKQKKAAEIAWSIGTGEYELPGLYVEDINGDGKKEILYSFAASLVCTDDKGNKLWEDKGIGDNLVLGIYDCWKNGQNALVVLAGNSIVLYDPVRGRRLTSTYISTGKKQVYFVDMAEEYAGKEILVISGDIKLYSYASGGQNLIWSYSETNFTNYFPGIAVGDFNNDGQKDVFFTTHSLVGVINGETGKRISQKTYVAGGNKGNGRNYGYFYVTDINGDGCDDAVLVAAYLNEHVEVVVNNNNKVKMLYDIFYEFDTNQNEYTIRPVFNGCHDVDGDGEVELIYSVYNAEGSGKWETYIIPVNQTSADNAVNAAQKLGGLFAKGVVDIDGDGKSEIIGTIEEARSNKEYTSVAMYKLDDSGEYKLVGTYDDANILTNTFFAYPDNFGSCHSYDEVSQPIVSNINGKGVFFVKTKDGTSKALHYNGTGLEVVLTVNGNVVYAKDLDGDNKDEIFSIVGDKCIAFKTDLAKAAEVALGGPYNKIPVAGDIDADGSVEILIVSEKSATLIKSNARGASVLWTIPAYGSRANDYNIYTGLIAPVGNNGELRAVFGTPDKSTGESRISVYKADGTEEWGYTFEGYYNDSRSGIYQYTYGDANGDGTADLFVFLMRGGEYTESIFVVDGKSHELIYKNEGKVGPRAAGPMPSYATLFDMDADKTDELIFNARDYFCIYKWNSETNTYDLKTKKMSGTKYWHDESMPVVIDNTLYFVLNGSPYHYGVLDSDGNVIWEKDYTRYASNYLYYNTIADFDGDGKPEIAMLYQEEGRIISIDILTGEVEAIITGKEINSRFVLSADLDSDNIAEIFYATTRGDVVAYNIGDRNALSDRAEKQLLFSVSLGYYASGACATDADGDNGLDILVCTNDGKLYCISPVKPLPETTSGTAA